MSVFGTKRTYPIDAVMSANDSKRTLPPQVGRPRYVSKRFAADDLRWLGEDEQGPVLPLVTSGGKMGVRSATLGAPFHADGNKKPR